MSEPRPPAIVIMGPTASGKSDVAIALARSLNCEIISVDSAMVYRGMDIGTAKPPRDVMREIPHHLIDILDPAESYSAGEFREQALMRMAAIRRRGGIPLLVGGTMLYHRALWRGLAALPKANADVRWRLEAEAGKYGWSHLHQRLAALDPVAAATIHPHDPQRIQRALEVYELSGEPLTALWRARNSEPVSFEPIKLVIAPEERSALHRRIEQRFLVMLERGLIDEVERLFARKDLHPSLPSIRTVGYRQVWCHLRGDYDRATMIERAIAATRQFAKRQLTWLRKEKPSWSYVSEHRGLVDRILKDLTPFLR